MQVKWKGDQSGLSFLLKPISSCSACANRHFPGTLMVCFALMQIDLAVTLLLVFAYLFMEGYAVYCRFKIEKDI